MKSKNRVVKRYECYQTPPPPSGIEKIYSKRFWWISIGREKGKEKNIGARGTKKYIYRVTSRWSQSALKSDRTFQSLIIVGLDGGGFGA